VQVNYVIENESTRATTGVAAYNVAPLNLGAHFRKINCFCFTDQTLKPGEKRDVTVVFYVDPELAKDPDGEDVNTITLSYTFFSQRETQRPIAQSAPAERPGKI
jgi:cytochrome c oxidase assembly protein subunit 11